jgi:chemotaxis protein methyltransferase CheR
MMRWFEEEGGQQWRISSDLRDAVRFQVHSLMEAPPQRGRFDLILCRNVLLYFAAPAQKAVFARLAQASAPDATLMLGAGETIIGHTDAFEPDPEHRGLYLRVPAPSKAKMVYAAR